MTDFPMKGEDQAITLRNSNHPQFDRAFAESLKEDHPSIWDAGGNIRGNDAFVLWGRAREGSKTPAVLDWIKEREAWAARHFEDGRQFPQDEPTMSNIAGVVAAMKWGVILGVGESVMKTAVRDLIDKTEDRASVGGVDGFSEAVKNGLENKVEEYNEDIDSDDRIHRATNNMVAKVFKRGVGAYETNPASVRPSVSSAEQWAYARVNSFLYALKNEKFRSGKHDTDLFPSGHPLRSTEDSEDARARVGTVDGEPVFSTIAEAEAYAEKIGCSGYHTHDLEGETVYMACESHSDATGDDDGDGGGYRKTTTIMERRFLTTNIEARQDDPETQDIPRIEGYATVFNETADLGPFTETIDRNAFEHVMNDDVRMLFNHDPNFPLARSKNGQGTLEMRVDDKGVFFSYPVGPQSYAKDLHESIKRGDVDQASFAFTVQADEWEERDGRPHRHITQLGSLTDLSVVTYPAYEATKVMARSLPEVPTTEPQPQIKVEEREPTMDRVKWSRSKLALANLKNQP